jgi:porin
VGLSGRPEPIVGVFGNFGIGDNNPNPIRWSASTGISGTSPISGRTRDTFAVGCYFLAVSDVLKQEVRPSTPLRNDHGVELFYNAAITPWCHITPDLQVISPFERTAGTAVVLGLRLSVVF